MDQENQVRRQILASLEPRMALLARIGLSSEDLDRIAFLVRLANAPVEITDWERNLMRSFLGDPRPLTQAQRAAVDQMRSDYDGKF